MSFNEIYSILKNENEDKMCFVETGTFFVTIGSDAECLTSILELSKICFSEGICKAGFPNNSLSKYMKIMHDMGIPYVVYGYLMDENSKYMVEIEYNGKKYTKLAEMDGDRVIASRIQKLYRTFKPDCNRCEYRKNKLLKEIKSCERRKEKLKLELQRIMINEAMCKDVLSKKNNNFLNEEVTLFNLFYDNSKDDEYVYMNKVKDNVKSKENNILYLIPKYEKYMEYMIDSVVSKLPRIEKFNLGNEIKISMFESIKYIMILSKVENNKRLGYLNMLDANICVERIYVRIMYKRKYIDNKRYMYIMEMLAEIGKMIGGYIKWVRG